MGPVSLWGYYRSPNDIHRQPRSLYKPTLWAILILSTEYVLLTGEGASLFRHNQGYDCPRLHIMEERTVFWLPYTGRYHIPPRAVMAGHTASGDVVYVTKFYSNNDRSLAGHYVDGTERTFGVYGGVVQSSTTMMMLVVLWLPFVLCFMIPYLSWPHFYRHVWLHIGLRATHCESDPQTKLQGQVTYCYYSLFFPSKKIVYHQCLCIYHQPHPAILKRCN